MPEILVVVDLDNNTEEWWDAAEKCFANTSEFGDLWNDLRRNDSAISTPDKALQFKIVCAKLPGWDSEDAPNYARHPLLFLNRL